MIVNAVTNKYEQNSWRLRRTPLEKLISIPSTYTAISICIFIYLRDYFSIIIFIVVISVFYDSWSLLKEETLRKNDAP